MDHIMGREDFYGSIGGQVLSNLNFLVLGMRGV